MKNFNLPSYRDCARVCEAMKEQPVLKTYLRRPHGFVYGREGQKFAFPRTVLQVAASLQSQGLSAQSASQHDLVLAAVKVLGLASAQALARKEAAKVVINYRLTQTEADQIDALLKKQAIVGIVSRDQFCRKVLVDFLAKRLRYANPADLRVDAFSLSKAVRAHPGRRR